MKTRTRTALILCTGGALIAAAVALGEQKASSRTANAGRKPAPVAQVAPVVQQVVVTPEPDKPLPIGDGRIQVALLLDTSGSMSGLIDQAKSQLWKIVNEFSHAKKDGKRPRLEIALYVYGTPSYGADNGFIKQLTPFTDDLDKLSELLFALGTDGGDEYCGQVIQTAVKGLEWSSRVGDLKFIFIAGNEEFTQGEVSYKTAIRAAEDKGIRVNVISAGGEDPTWKEAALFAHGEYLVIDHNRVVAHIASPQDAEIARLGALINDTYVAYGADGRRRSERQASQDANAEASQPGAMMQRAVAKGSSYYRNDAWDLVDGLREGTVDLDKMKEEDLPEPMRKMSLEERKAYVEAKAAERAKIQKQIAELNVEREKYVAAEREKQGLDSADTLDAAMIKAVRDQANKGGWKFDVVGQ
jgi:hypothetical protein